MLRRSFAVLALALALAPAAVSFGQFKQGDFDLTLSGAGSNDKDFRTFSVNAIVGVGYFVTDQIEVGLRPGVSISDGGSEYLWTASAFADYNFDLGKFVPFAGANIGYQFGGGSSDDGFSAGPEVGIKYFLNSSTYVYGSAAYQFNLNEGIEDGAFVYGLGLGVRL
jgi:hypothetical protein